MSTATAALLNHLTRVMHARSESLLAEHGLRPRHLVALTTLRDHGSRSQQDLAAALQIDKTNLVGLLNELEAEGLVERRRSSEDRRRHVVAITKAGERRLEKAERALGGLEDEVFAGLSAKERRTLHDLLNRALSGHVADCAAATREWAAAG